ncbi:MAG: pyrimidine 5'-nucleotidase [Mariprofundales bacterium]|nr:pyrimidine 5'-nucleotidase [Mariprofundales bacterium]
MQKSSLPQPQLIIFDLDNTLYHADNGLFAQMDRNINHFICSHLKLNWHEADTLRLRYWKRYGTTLTGLMRHHAITPEPFLEMAHNLNIDSALNHNPQLDRLLHLLPARKVIHTNGTCEHAQRVMLRLGVLNHFTAIYDIRFNNYQPKPCSRTLQMVLQKERAVATTTLVIDDLADNLHAADSIGCQTAWITAQQCHQHPFGYHCSSITTLLTQLIT